MEELVFTGNEEVGLLGRWLVACRATDDSLWLPVVSTCEVLALDYPTQLEVLCGNPLFETQLRLVRGQEGAPNSELRFYLPLAYVRAWLLLLDPGQATSDLQDELARYRKRGIAAIDAAFDPPSLYSQDLRTMEAMRERALNVAELWNRLITERKRRG